MKKMLKVIGRQSRRLCITIAVIGFTVSCGGGPGGGSSSNGNPPIIKAEPMSNKTAMEYFRDEGITVGINLGNTLCAVDFWTDPANHIAVETAWGDPKANQALFNGYKDQGFNIVRIPVTWVGHIGSAPDYKVEKAYLKRVAEVVGYAKNAGLKAFINMHHDGHDIPEEGEYGWFLIRKAVESKSDCDQLTDKFAKVWTQIAEYFINYGDYLMFEGMNEIFNRDQNAISWSYLPVDAEEYEIVNTWNQTFLDSVRATGGNNASRYLIFPGYGTDWEKTASSYFKLPVDVVSGRQIVSFHFYDPSDFVMFGETHEWLAAGWTKTYIDTAFGEMKTYFTSKDIPVIMGENGPFRYTKNDANTPAAQANRLDYIDYMYGKARENEIVPCYWETSYSPGDPGGDASLFNRNTGAPNSEESAVVIQHMINAVK